jgi:hypothetical protein
MNTTIIMMTADTVIIIYTIIDDKIVERSVLMNSL